MPAFVTANWRRQALIGAGFLLALALTAFLYWPGLDSLFMLDDRAQLQSLDGIAAVPTLRQAAIYITSGTASQLGRPLSLLTFAPQYYAWPSYAWTFKYVNLLIHLLNGCLLFLLLQQLGALASTVRKHRTTLAWIATTLWLLHPLQVSTVLYIIQRMTELAALFTLLGLLGYVHGRRKLGEGAVRKGYLWMSAGIGLGTTLGVLSKENAILLPLYVLVLEATLLRELPRPRGWRPWAGIFLYLPLFTLLGHLVFKFESYFITGYAHRDFTLGERLLTECRVLFDYLGKILFPNPSSFGLFYDSYSISRGLFTPPVTAAAVAGIIALLATGLAWRRRMPVYSFAVLWFFGGHLLESTVIALELVFEHRNYLPMVGILYAIAYYTLMLWERLRSRALRRVSLATGLAILLLIPAITREQAQLWKQPGLQAAVWVAERPNSERALEWAGGIAAAQENYAGAAKLYRRVSRLREDDGGGIALWLLMGCYDTTIDLPDRKKVLERFRKSRLNTAILSSLEHMVDKHYEGKCGSIEDSFIQEALAVLIDNPNFRPSQRSLYFLQGELHYRRGHLDAAISSLDLAFARGRKAEIALIQAGWLTDNGFYSNALRYLYKARAAAKQNPIKAALYAMSLPEWEQLLRDKIAAQEPPQQ